MRRCRIPFEAGGQCRAHQHRLTEGDAAQGGGVEAREGVERIALDLGARDRGVQEIQIEERVVPHQHRARAVRGAHGIAYLAKYSLQRVLLRDRRPQRMMRIDAVHRQRRGLQFGPGKRRDVIAMSLAAPQGPVAAHLDEHRGNFQQGVRLRVEPAGFNIDHHRQKTAEARGEGNGWESASCRFRRGKTPSNRFATAIGDHRAAAEAVPLRGHPGLLDQGDGFAVTRQPIEIRAEMAGEGLKPIQAAGSLERLRVQLERGVGGEHAGAAAGVLLVRALVGRAVGAEKVTRIAAGRGRDAALGGPVPASVSAGNRNAA